MSHFYLDTSAVVKRYLVETGTAWVMALAAPAGGHTIIVGEITRVEAAAAIAARHRAPGGITRRERDGAVNLLLHHCDTDYQINRLNDAIVARAVALTQRQRLRGYDAVQLATALAADAALRAAGLPGLTFVAADGDLVAAAQAEGLLAHDPNHHP